jgi:hypothetical protein
MLPELRTDLFGKNANRKFYTVSQIVSTCTRKELICSNFDGFLLYMTRMHLCVTSEAQMPIGFFDVADLYLLMRRESDCSQI